MNDQRQESAPGQPKPGLSELQIVEFTASEEFVFDTGTVSIRWVCEGAKTLKLERRKADEKDFAPVSEAVFTTAGDLSFLIEEDTEFRLTVADEQGRTLSQVRAIDRISSWWFNALWMSVALALIASWVLSEGLFHDVSLIENDRTLQLGIVTSRALSILQSILSAPLAITLLSFRYGQFNTATGLARELLHRPKATALLIALSLVPLGMVMLVSGSSKQVYISSEVDLPVHVWESEDKRKLSLTIPPGLNTARVWESPASLEVLDPEGAQLLHGENQPLTVGTGDGRCLTRESRRPGSKRPGFLRRAWDSWASGGEFWRVVCEQRVGVIDEYAGQSQLQQLAWGEQTGAPPSKTEGGLVVFEWRVSDCSSYADAVTYVRESAPGQFDYERLVVEVDFSCGVTDDMVFRVDQVTIPMPGWDRNAYLTLGNGLQWMSTKLCRKGAGSCSVGVPSARDGQPANFMCITPAPVKGRVYDEAGCAKDQDWYTFARLGIESNVDLETEPTVDVDLCLPSSFDGREVELRSPAQVWRGRLSQLHANAPLRAPRVDELMIRVGDESFALSPGSLADLGSTPDAIPAWTSTGWPLRPIELPREGFALSRVRLRSSSGPITAYRSKCALTLEGIPEKCEGALGATGSIQGDFANFSSLPAWTKNVPTRWNHGKCRGIPGNSCTLEIDRGKGVLTCED